MSNLRPTEVTLGTVAEYQYFVDNIEQFVHVKTLTLYNLDEIANQNPELFRRFCEAVLAHLPKRETLSLSGKWGEISSREITRARDGEVIVDPNSNFGVLCNFIERFAAKNLFLGNLSILGGNPVKLRRLLGAIEQSPGLEALRLGDIPYFREERDFKAFLGAINSHAGTLRGLKVGGDLFNDIPEEEGNAKFQAFYEMVFGLEHLEHFWLNGDICNTFLNDESVRVLCNLFFDDGKRAKPSAWSLPRSEERLETDARHYSRTIDCASFFNYGGPGVQAVAEKVWQAISKNTDQKYIDTYLLRSYLAGLNINKREKNSKILDVIVANADCVERLYFSIEFLENLYAAQWEQLVDILIHRAKDLQKIMITIPSRGEASFKKEEIIPLFQQGWAEVWRRAQERRIDWQQHSDTIKFLTWRMHEQARQNRLERVYLKADDLNDEQLRRQLQEMNIGTLVVQPSETVNKNWMVAEDLLRLLSLTPQPRIGSIDLREVDFRHLDVGGTFDKFLKQLEGCLGNTTTTIIFPSNIPAEKQQLVDDMVRRLQENRAAAAPLMFRGPGSPSSASTPDSFRPEQGHRPA